MLSTKTSNWLRYWRNSLADAESGKGSLKRKDLQMHLKLDILDFQAGIINDSCIIEKLFEKESDKTQIVKAIARPIVYFSKYEHGKKYTSIRPDVISPIISLIWVSRRGWFYPAGKPEIPRDLLSPQADDKFSLFDISKLDDFHTRNETISFSEEEALAWITHEKDSEKCFNGWKSYHSIMQKLFSKLDKNKIEEGYLPCKEQQAYVMKVDAAQNFSRGILELYDWLKDENITSCLLENYAQGIVKNHSPCIRSSNALSVRLGHSNSKFPLAVEQRDALTQVMKMDEGEILAVNGPPGTGKTTFVLSVVASLWIKAALDESEPPLIIAASTNNQAVTNVIAAFGKDFEENHSTFSGRWLPDIKSYGGYFPASGKENEASALYQTKSFYEKLEQSKYLDRAESNFLEKANYAFEDEEFKTTKLVKERLLKTIKKHYSSLKQFNSNWSALEHAKTKCLEAYLCTIQESVQNLKIKEYELKIVKEDNKKWKNYLAHESIWLTLFRWLPPVNRKLQLLRDIFIEDEFNKATKSLVKDHLSTNELLKKWLNSKQQDCDRHRELNNKWCAAQDKWDKAVENILQDFRCSDKNDIDEIDRELDTTLRFKLFQLTVHYWEARWLLECRDLEEKNKGDVNWAKPEKTGPKSVRPRWRRRMMLTPCIVSTLHSLPAHMAHWTYGNCNDDYLSNEIDLLIIDEAGQVAPEVAAASFALAKKALVIGDTHQIEPIQSLTHSVDIGNLIQHKVMKDKAQFSELSKTGATVTKGSVMQIAQRTSCYHYQPKAEPGMFLREHRRCYDEIISFCNDLCYQGLLIPKRGKSSAALFPPMSYLHIDGRAEVSATGSRSNFLEAAQVASWLEKNRDLIESYYKKQGGYKKNTPSKLEDLVGVVTPFKAQQLLIEIECNKRGVKANDSGKKVEGAITIGTVHALQGAERPLIIFSAVYSRHSDGGFIDMSPSMLNVAVSRAKDSFIVFGDMDVISGASHGKPRSLLAQYLFKSGSNELVFSLNERPDLLKICSAPKLINDAVEHDRLIKQLLEETVDQISLVSPWVSIIKLKETGLYEKMVAAVDRGVKVHLYSDKHFNTTIMNQYDKNKSTTFKDCCKQLESVGISVFVVSGVHSKLVMADDKFLIVGSYNWGSAARTGKYANMETSIIYTGNLEQEIYLQIKALKLKLISP